MWAAFLDALLRHLPCPPAPRRGAEGAGAEPPATGEEGPRETPGAGAR